MCKLANRPKKGADMNTLVDRAKELLKDGSVCCIIGYAANNNSRRLHPFIAKSTDDAERLTFNHYALNNLSVFLNIIQKALPGKIGIIAKGCDVASIYAMVKEHHLIRSSIYIIGLPCHGIVEDYLKKWSAANVASKCFGCLLQTPILVDEIIDITEMAEKSDDKLVA